MIRKLTSGKYLCVLLMLAFGSACAPAQVAATPAAETEPAPSPTLEPTLAATATRLPAPSQTPSPPAPAFHDPETRTGVGDVDRIIDVVLEGDSEKIKDALTLTVTGCTRADGLGGPPKCREGEPEGTPVEVLPFLGPEGNFLRRDELDEWPGIEVAGLYAVYLVSEAAYSDENYPAGEYAVVFLDASEVTHIALQVVEGGIVRIDYIFGDSLDTRLERDAEEILLPPPG